MRMSELVPAGPVAHDVAFPDTGPLQATAASVLEGWALGTPLNGGTIKIAPSSTNTAVKIRRNCRIVVIPLFWPDIRQYLGKFHRRGGFALAPRWRSDHLQPANQRVHVPLTVRVDVTE